MNANSEASMDKLTQSHESALAAAKIGVGFFAVFMFFLVYLHSLGKPPESEWVGRCAKTVAGAVGIIDGESIGFVSLAFPAGNHEEYRKGEIQMISCPPGLPALDKGMAP